MGLMFSQVLFKFDQQIEKLIDVNEVAQENVETASQEEAAILEQKVVDETHVEEQPKPQVTAIGQISTQQFEDVLSQVNEDPKEEAMDTMQ